MSIKLTFRALALRQSERANDSLWRRANARNVIFNLVDITKLSDLCCAHNCEDHSCRYKNVGISIFKEIATICFLFKYYLLVLHIAIEICYISVKFFVVKI